MKMFGKKVATRNEIIIALPRNNSEDIVFVATAVMDTDGFDRILGPPPVAYKVVAGGRRVIDTNPLPDSDVGKEMRKREVLYTHWLMLESIRDTPGLEFERVVYEDPETWHLMEEEFQEAGLTPVEIGRIRTGVIEANSFSEKLVEEARDRFLSQRAAGVLGQSSSQGLEPTSTPSGGLASA